jgi:murein DD-endopeptidase MepM/ murein hydrolase activator NlpD
VQYPRSGNVAILTRSDGLAFYHLHLSRFVTPGAVKEGDIIGYSGGAKGAPGSGSSTGPHLHVNAYLHGVVRDIHDFFTTTAGNGRSEIDMPLDAADKQFLNELGAAIVQQISGSAPAIYGTGGPTIEQVRADLGYLRDTTFKSIQESVSALTVDSKGAADIAPLLAAINALPAQTATAVKAALKAAL